MFLIFFMTICLNINIQFFQCLISTNIHFNTWNVPQFIVNNGIILSPSVVDLSFFLLSCMSRGFRLDPII